jgi:hypothetical protein
MVPQSLQQVFTTPDTSEPFDSAQWLLYFEKNRMLRSKFIWPATLNVVPPLRPALVSSLQRFQIGETGEGRHLRQYAASTGDRVFEVCVDMFIKEEQEHALLLASAIKTMGGTLLSSHWTDSVFIALRQSIGLKTAILILFLAEVIGKTFYELVHQNTTDPFLEAVFEQIVHDEEGHIRFHTHYLRRAFESFSPTQRQVTYIFWTTAFWATCIVFVADNQRAIRLLNTDLRNFIQLCHQTFRQSALWTLRL